MALERDQIRGIAEAMHATMCRGNHTDQCGWYYEFSYPTPTWDAWAHDRWYRRAFEVASALDPDIPPGVIVMVLQAVKGV